MLTNARDSGVYPREWSQDASERGEETQHQGVEFDGHPRGPMRFSEVGPCRIEGNICV